MAHSVNMNGVEDISNNDLNLVERIKKLEESKFVDIMGHITYYFRVNTYFDVSSIAIVSFGDYLFFFFDYFLKKILFQ